MSLFDGVEGFTPAFTGQEIANQTGSGAASAWSSGMSAGSGRMNANTDASALKMKSSYLEQSKNDNAAFMSAFQDFMSGGKIGDQQMNAAYSMKGI